MFVLLFVPASLRPKRAPGKLHMMPISTTGVMVCFLAHLWINVQLRFAADTRLRPHMAALRVVLLTEGRGNARNTKMQSDKVATICYKSCLKSLAHYTCPPYPLHPISRRQGLVGDREGGVTRGSWSLLHQ